MRLGDLLTFAFAQGIAAGAIRRIPIRIYLAGHFTKADIPAFSDFKTLADVLSSIRNTFITTKESLPVTIEFPDNEPGIALDVRLRDTMLLTPANAKSLEALGKLVQTKKIKLDEDFNKDLDMKRNMDVLLAKDPDLFERYAINDAVICAKYIEVIINQYQDMLGRHRLPPTLTSIGVDLLLDNWKKQPDFSTLDALGKHAVLIRNFNKKLGRTTFSRKEVNLEPVQWGYDFASECYHGGRNEQFWFGPGFEDEWTDHDLAGAYPTAMALIGYPDWRKMRASTRVADFTPETLGIANVEFEFPKRVRFPTLPVRTDNGLVFPRKGKSNCAAPEIALAKALGAKLRITYGLIVPSDPQRLIFGPFIKGCVEKRKGFDKNTFGNLFWKEISNSTYGKTAQGLKFKLLYDSRDREMKELPPSKITNPYFAAFITSFVRAALGEVMNRLPKEACVFSCTTDGFLTNATDQQMTAAQSGPIADIFRKSRKLLTGEEELLETKHHIRKPLGWRTRGQATLLEGKLGKDDDSNIVLAKGGIYTDIPSDAVRPRNDYIVKLFWDREPDTEIKVKSLTGIREIIEYDADLVQKEIFKILSMEYDWKCRPSAVWDDFRYSHVAFSTQPWDSVDEFLRLRGYWTDYIAKPRRCIKTLDDYKAFANFVLSKSILGDKARYAGTKGNHDIRRLKQSLCEAWRYSAAGLERKKHGKTAAAFADVLISVGIPCAAKDPGNARKGFVPKRCAPTANVLDALDRLKAIFPSLDISEFIADGGGMDLTRTVYKRCGFRPLNLNKAEPSKASIAA